MPIHTLAGKPAPKDILVNLEELEKAYYEKKPDVNNPQQLVSFGTSGHRGTSLDGTFTESHIIAICQAICDYRKKQGYTGTLFVGKDTHYLSDFAQKTALRVFATNGVNFVCQENSIYCPPYGDWSECDYKRWEQEYDEKVQNGEFAPFTPTPVISWHILQYNKDRSKDFADGVIITPSHNPPSDGGIKYNPPNGGPADTEITNWIQNRADKYLKDRRGIKMYYCYSPKYIDFRQDYINALGEIIDMDAIRKAKIRIGVDPLGGAGVHYWKPIAEKYGLDITVVNEAVDPQFGFMCVDRDGKIRMDCSSPYAMNGLIALKDKFDIAFANDPDTDRHGIVVPSVGLMPPNHYLAVAIQYLFKERKTFAARNIGKTLVSSGIIDKVAAELGVPLIEVPVGFKWFVDGLYNGTLGFGGEESAGASFLRFDGTVWATDKDGIILNLLAAEILAKTGKDPGVLYQEIEKQHGKSFYARVDQPTTPEAKAAFKKLIPEKVAATKLAGDCITAKLTNAPGNNASIGGLKVVSTHGWFAARPSGTENIYKIYSESFRSEEHLQAVLHEAKTIVDAALN